LDLEAAAGVGRLNAVRRFFDRNGKLKKGATTAQMKSGFNWSCAYGRTSVVEFLLPRGIRLAECHRGETGLHWAAYGGHLEIVRLLLEHGAPVDVKDETWDNTPLGWAVHGWENPSPEFRRPQHLDVIALLIAAGATVEPRWQRKFRAAPRIRSSLGVAARVHRK
jgi:ankyrin repeat protein